MCKVTPASRGSSGDAQRRILPPGGRYGIAAPALFVRQADFHRSRRKTRESYATRAQEGWLFINFNFPEFCLRPAPPIWTYAHARARARLHVETNVETNRALRDRMETRRGRGKKRERRRRKTSSKHVDVTAPRNYRTIYWIWERGARGGGDGGGGCSNGR